MPFLNNPFSLKSDAFLKFLLHLGFLFSGVVTVFIGQVLPILSERLSLNDTEAGYFFIAQCVGSIIGTFSTQYLVRKFGFQMATVIGIFQMGVGVFGLNSDLWIVCLAAFFLIGLGIGMTLLSINMLMVELNPKSITPSLNFLHFFWGVGAVFCKPYVDFFSFGTSIFTPTAILGTVLLPTGLAIAFAPAAEISGKQVAENHPENSSIVPIWSTLTAWLIALFNFVHVGVESGIGGWMTTYANRLTSDSANEAINWFSPTLAYFLFFVLGRLSARMYAVYFSENKVLLLSLLIMTSGIIIILLAENTELLSVGAGIAGFGTSSIFPTNMARFAKTFGETASRRAALLFVSGTLGAAFISWFIGYISTGFNGLRYGLFVLLGSCLGLIALQISLSLKTRS